LVFPQQLLWRVCWPSMMNSDHGKARDDGRNRSEMRCSMASGLFDGQYAHCGEDVHGASRGRELV